MSLLAHYKLNGDAADASGNGHDGTPTDVSWAAGKIGQAGSFNGGTSRIDVSLSDPAGSRTFCCWCKASSNEATARYLMDSQSGRMIFAWRGSAGTVTICYYYNGTWRNFGTTPTDGLWHHVAFVCDAAAGQATCYLDGAQLGTPQTYTPTALGGATAIGARYALDSATFNGLIDDVRLYAKALTDGNIMAIYNNGDGSEAEVFGPYRCELAQGFCSGAAAGETFSTGAAIGQDYITGAVVGQTS